MRPSRLLPSLVLILGGCPGGDSDSGSGPAPSGCIELDGSGGYGLIQDAVNAASSGSVITLCNGDFDEAVTIDSSIVDLTIEGGGYQDTFWNAPTNQVAVTIAGAGTVTFRGIGFTSDRTGIEAEDTTVVLDEVIFYRPGSYGVDAVNSEITVTNSEFQRAVWGGIVLDGGVLDVSNSVFTENASAGIRLDGGATATITGNAFDLHMPDSGYLNEGEGYAVAITDSTASLSGNSFLTNAGDVWCENGSVSLDGDGSTSSWIGMWLKVCDATVTGVAFTDYLQYGIVDESGATLTLTDTTITTDPAIAADQSAPDDFSGSYGIIAFGPNITMTGGEVSGNNGGGIYLASEGDTPSSFTATSTLIDNNARQGLAVYGGEITLTDVAVTNTVDDDPNCVESYSWWCNMAIQAWESSLDMVGGQVSGNGDWGVLLLAGASTISGTAFDDASGAAMWINSSALVCDDCTFTNNGQYSAYVQTSDVTFANPAFEGGSYTSIIDWQDGEITHYYYQASDVFALDSEVTISNGTFTDGDSGVFVSGGELAISDSSFTSYNSNALGASSDAVADVSGTTFSDIGNYALYCYLSSLDADDVAIENVTEEQYKYESYVDDVLQYSYETTFQGDAMYASDCSLSFDNVTIEEVYGQALSVYDSEVDFEDVTLAGIVREGSSYEAALYMVMYDTVADVMLTDVTITGVDTGYGIYLLGDADQTGNTVLINGLSLGQPDSESRSGIGGPGLFLSSLDGVSITGIDIEGTASDGIRLTDVVGVITGPGEGRTGTITDPGANGILTTNSSVTITGVAVSGATESGISLGTGTCDVQQNDVSTAGEFGMECAGTTFAACLDNQVNGTLGDYSGCDCDPPADTDAGDTDVVDTDVVDTDTP